jgi:hypothetical protein
MTIRKKQRELLAELIESRDGIEPNYYSGGGRWTKKSSNYVEQLAELLGDMGLVRWRHFETGNRAPQGGHTGDFIRLLPAGRKLKAIRRAATEFSWRPEFHDRGIDR